MHMKNVGHFDIKPANIMMSRSDGPKIGDFGLSRFTDNSEKKRQNLGYTIYYAPPEQIRG